MLNILEETRTSICTVPMSRNKIFEWRMIGSLHIILTDHCWFIKAHDVGDVRELDVVVYMYASGRRRIWETLRVAREETGVTKIAEFQE